MDFKSGSFTQNNENNAVEIFIRTLVSQNELSLARNIITSLGEDYNHLLFEVEVQAGNYKKAMEIFNYLPKEKQQMYIHIADTIEKDAEKVSEVFGNLIRNLQSENFPVFIVEAQKLKKDYPQIIEVIALELIAAVRRGDKKKIRTLSNILEQLDKSHPALSQVRKSKNLMSVFAPAILIALFVIVLSNLIISIFSLITSDTVAFSNLNKQITNIGKTLDSLSNQNAQNNNQLNSLLESIENLKQSLEKINNLIEESRNQNASQDSVSKDLLTKMNEELDRFKKNLETVLFNIRTLDNKISALSLSGNTKTDSTVKAANIIDQERLIQSVKDNEEKLNKLLNDFTELNKSISNLSQKVEAGHTIKYNSEYDSKINELILSIENIISEITQIKANIKESYYQNYQVKGSNDNSLTQIEGTLQNLLKTMDNANKPGNIEEISTLKDMINMILQQLDEIKSQFDRKSQPQSTENTDSQKPTNDLTQDIVAIKNKLNMLEQNIEKMKNAEVISNEISNLKVSVYNLEKLIDELKKSPTYLNQDITNIKNKLNSLEQKVEEIKSLVDTLKTPEKQLNELSNNEVSNLKLAISNLEKVIEELKSSIKNTNEQLTDIKTNLSEVNKSGKIESTSQKVTNLSDVQRVIRETKDLYELYRAGISYYLNKLYQEALYVLIYVEDQLEGIDVYFKEDVYYYQIMSYLKLGDNQNAQKKFQEYKKAFPSGRYVNELGALF